MQALCQQLPALLGEFHADLQQAIVTDLLHVCLRTLSYFMYHRTLAAVFSDAQVSMFPSDIISLLCSTQDEVRACACSNSARATASVLTLLSSAVQLSCR